jgi:hypothetical protein
MFRTKIAVFGTPSLPYALDTLPFLIHSNQARFVIQNPASGSVKKANFQPARLLSSIF